MCRPAGVRTVKRYQIIGHFSLDAVTLAVCIVAFKGGSFVPGSDSCCAIVLCNNVNFDAKAL